MDTKVEARLPILERLLQVVVAGLACVYLLGLLAVMLLRMRYPFELEWIESATVDSCRWILAGHFLYERLSLTFTPLLYNPLYFYFGAAVSLVTGPGFLAPRLVSVLATAGCCGLLWALVRWETGNGWAGLAAAGFYAATYEVSGSYMDVARADALLVMFLAAAAYVARRYRGRGGALACAAILTLAYFTKQSALPFLVAMGGFYLLESRGEWRLFWPVLMISIGGLSWLIDRLSGGWYSFYTWYIVRQTVLDAERIRGFWTLDMLPHVTPAMVGGLAALLLLGNPLQRSSAGSRSRFYWAWTAGAFAGSWWNRSAAGAHTNTLMPVMLGLALLQGLLLGLPKPARWGQLFRCAALVVFAAQCLGLAYDPRRFVPSARDEQAGWRLVELIRSYPGDVFVPEHSYYAAMAGKPTYVHWAAFTDAAGLWDTNLDVQRGGRHDSRRQIVLDELDAALAEKRFAAIILDDVPKEIDAFWAARLEQTYRFDRYVFAAADEFWTVTGVPLRPQLVYVPR